FVGAGFLATKIVPDLNPNPLERSEAARAERGSERDSESSTMTQPASPGAGPAAPPAQQAPRVAANEKKKGATLSSRNAPQKELDSDSTAAKRESTSPSLSSVGSMGEAKPDDAAASAGGMDKIERLNRQDAPAEVRQPALASEDAKVAPVPDGARRRSADAPAPAPLLKEQERASAKAMAPEPPMPQSILRAPASKPRPALKDDAGGRDESAPKSAVATGSNAAGSRAAAGVAGGALEGAGPDRSTSGAERRAAGAISGQTNASDFIEAAQQPRLVAALGVETSGAVGLRRQIDEGGALDARSAPVDVFIALSAPGSFPAGVAGEALHAEAAPSPYGRGPRFIVALFELASAAAKEPVNARLDVDPALVLRYRLVGRSVPSAASGPIRIIYELELRRAPRSDERLSTLQLLRRDGSSVTSTVLTGRELAPRWEDARAGFRAVSLAAVLSERLRGSPQARSVDAALLERRLEAVARIRPQDADLRRLVRLAKDSAADPLAMPPAREFAPEPDVRR
ncbi:MAG: hypothetical protein ABIT01_03900, partial [Thermoanaerobaculia bacterium]